MKNLTFLFLFCWSLSTAQNGQSGIYLGGDIPTNLSTYDNTCSGPAQILFIIPDGSLYEVTSINVAYLFQSVAPESPLNQNSRLTCLNTGISETTFTSANSTPGAFQFYNRTDVDIANGIYNGGDTIVFELEVWRSSSSGSCGIDRQYVADGTFKMDISIGEEILTERVGINMANPLQTLHVDGKIQLGNDISPPSDGTIMFHEDSFYGYANGEWQRFSQEKVILGESDVATNGRFIYSGLYGLEAGNQMCKDAYPDEPTARMYFREDINNAISHGNVQGLVSNQSYWTLALSYDAFSTNSSQDDNCYQFNTNNGGVSSGTMVNISINETAPSSSLISTWANYSRNVACSFTAKIVCGK